MNAPRPDLRKWTAVDVREPPPAALAVGAEVFRRLQLPRRLLLLVILLGREECCAVNNARGHYSWAGRSCVTRRQPRGRQYDGGCIRTDPMSAVS